MRDYSNIIALYKNSRGVFSLDPTMGCNSGLKLHENGCYNDCYAARYSRKYGYDFSKTVLRSFKDESHRFNVVKQINKLNVPFIRMGTSGDPSENWGHTIKIIKQLFINSQLDLFNNKKKEIVIITKHWEHLTIGQMIEISKYNICINTSISALDNEDILKNGIKQYKRLKPYCRSVLRVVSFDFNLKNKDGRMFNQIQKELFDKYKIIDTVFRVSKKNQLNENGIINIKETKFMGKKCHISKMNKKTYFGKCENCIELCGLGKF